VYVKKRQFYFGNVNIETQFLLLAIALPIPSPVNGSMSEPVMIWFIFSFARNTEVLAPPGPAPAISTSVV
jgi:hypothetical protein